MKILLSIAIIFLLISCVDDDGNNQDNITNKQVSDEDLVGTWHYQKGRFLRNGKEERVTGSDTIIFEKNKNIIWYGTISTGNNNEPHSFYGEKCCWNLDTISQNLEFSPEADIFDDNGNIIGVNERKFEGIIEGYSNSSFNMLYNWYHDKDNYGSSTLTFVKL